jgi:apolipoprotein N-acyltransferase
VSAPTHHFYRNQSILIDGSGRILATYQKTYPVVFGEAYVAIAGSGELPVVNTMFGRMATAICNDFHFPALIRQAGRQDAEIMMAPYDDITPWGEQDATVAIFRAVENGYSMVRAAGNGMSMIADYQGRVFGQRAYDGEGGVMLAWVPKHGTVTVYSRIGDTFAYLCVLGLILLTGLAVARR